MSIRYKYKAATRDGNIQNGLVESEDIDSVKQNLDSKGLIPLSVKPAPDYKINLKKYFKPSVNLELLLSFSMRLNTLFKSGISIIRALKIIENEQENSDFGKKLIKISHFIEGGMTLSQAFKQFPEYFPPLYTSTIHAAEASGQLETVMERLNKLIDRDIKTKEMVKSAIRYPCYVMITIILAIAAVVTLVVPKLADFYKFQKAELPLPTLIILNLSDFVTSYWYLIIVFGVLTFFLFSRFKESSYGRHVLDFIKIEAPILGSLFLQLTISRFCYLMGTLLKSGLPLIETLKMVSEASGNSLIAKVINEMSDNIIEGKDIITPMRESKYFEPMVVQMLSIGMESGKLDDMSYEVARHYDAVIEYQSKKLAARIEPILTLFIAGMVLLLALAIFMPMWNMMQILK